jgi:hypothetical protein
MTNQVYTGFARMRNVQTGSIIILEFVDGGARVHAYWKPKNMYGTYARAGMRMPAVESLR